MFVCFFNGSIFIIKFIGDWIEVFIEGKFVRDYFSFIKEVGGNGVLGSF